LRISSAAKTFEEHDREVVEGNRVLASVFTHRYRLEEPVATGA
jgi:hypothetical protein